VKCYYFGVTEISRNHVAWGAFQHSVFTIIENSVTFFSQSVSLHNPVI